MKTYNPILNTDSYKMSHFNQYPEGTEYLYSYIEARGGDMDVCVLGMENFVQSVLMQRISAYDVYAAEIYCTEHGVPFNKEGWLRVVDVHNGYLPVIFRGLPEGTVVKPGTVIATLVNTDPELPWLESWLETAALRYIWYPTTVASQSRDLKKSIKEAMETTCDTTDGLPFKLHDFGARGTTSDEQARVGGMAHLVNFSGTDTLAALELIDDLYQPTVIAGYSIPATEHSTVTSWGRENERQMYEAFLRRNGGEGKLFACVSDSYNLWEALEMWADLDDVLKEVGGTLVVRPDSGDPIETPIKVIKRLMCDFGYTVNTKGFKVLPDRVRVIQGDGLNRETLKQLLWELESEGLSIDNIAFGMGGGLLQKVDRDTMKFAMKCSAARINGNWIDVFKDPIGDSSKKSKKGLVSCGMSKDLYRVLPEVVLDPARDTGMLKVYYANGVASQTDTWEEIKKRAEV